MRRRDSTIESTPDFVQDCVGAAVNLLLLPTYMRRRQAAQEIIVGKGRWGWSRRSPDKICRPDAQRLGDVQSEVTRLLFFRTTMQRAQTVGDGCRCMCSAYPLPVNMQCLINYVCVCKSNHSYWLDNNGPVQYLGIPYLWTTRPCINAPL